MRTNKRKMEFKRKLRRTADICLGDRAYLSERYKNIYGGGDHNERIEKIRRSNRNRYFLCFAAAVTVMIFLAAGNGTGNIDVTEDENGFAVEIKRDQETDDLMIPFEVYGSARGELFKRQVIVDAGALHSNEAQAEEDHEDPYGTMIGYKIDEAARNASQKKGRRIMLPEKLSDGTPIYWKKQEETGLPWLLMVFPVLIYAIYKKRFNGPDVEEEKARETIMKELPEFLNRLTLLLGTGMILGSAFEKIVEDHHISQKDQDNYFYTQMNRISENFRKANVPIHKGIEEFAKRSRIKEFIRVAGIISDNADKGTALIEKLDAESGAMWFARKQNMEEKGRLAESRLIAPLMLMLIILVVITVAPALMEM